MNGEGEVSVKNLKSDMIVINISTRTRKLEHGFYHSVDVVSVFHGCLRWLYFEATLSVRVVDEEDRISDVSVSVVVVVFCVAVQWMYWELLLPLAWPVRDVLNCGVTMSR